MSMNLHTRIFTLLVKRVYDSMEAPTLADLAAIWPPRGAEIQHVPELGLDVAVDDYEEAGLSAAARSMVVALNRILPRTDPVARWKSGEQAHDELGAMFGDRLRHLVVWADPSSDAALVRLCTHGLAAHCLERSSDGAYAVDFSFMERYPVRGGFVRYGAKLVLDRREDGLVPRSIRWARGEHRPGDAEWELAKLQFRVSCATAVTVRDHAVNCHFLASNAAVIATRTKLPATHPVRSLLRPFQFRTPAINAGALVTLIPERAIFHRLFAFEWEGLAQLYADAKADYRMEILPRELSRRGLDDLEPHAYGEDARGLWQCAHTLSTEYLDAIAMRPDPLGDPDLAAWHAELRRVLPATAAVPPIETRAQLAELLAQLIFVATGYHEQVGGAIADYLDRPDFVVPTMCDGRTYEECWPSRQTMVQAYMLGVLTNFAMPKILDDFSSLVPREARPAVRRWLGNLRAHGVAVDARNGSRAQPIRTFHPKDLEISVSI